RERLDTALQRGDRSQQVGRVRGIDAPELARPHVDPADLELRILLAEARQGRPERDGELALRGRAGQVDADDLVKALAQRADRLEPRPRERDLVEGVTREEGPALGGPQVYREELTSFQGFDGERR